LAHRSLTNEIVHPDFNFLRFLTRCNYAVGVYGMIVVCCLSSVRL